MPARRQIALAAAAACALALAAGGCGLGDDSGDSAATTTTDPGQRAERTRPRKPKPKSAQDRYRYPKAEPKAIQSGPDVRKRVVLTFDADMTEATQSALRSGELETQNDERLVKLLRRTRTPATFFITGMWAKEYPDMTRSIARDPLFEVGSHTYDHLAWTNDCYGLPAVDGTDAKLRQIKRTARILRRLTGRKPFWFRFPGLCHDQSDLDLVASEGEQAVDGISSGDAFASSAEAVVEQTLASVEPGSIVVMHNVGPPNAPVTRDAVERLIPELRDRGYEFVTLGELFGYVKAR